MAKLTRSLVSAPVFTPTKRSTAVLALVLLLRRSRGFLGGCGCGGGGGRSSCCGHLEGTMILVLIIDNLVPLTKSGACVLDGMSPEGSPQSVVHERSCSA